MRLCQSCICTVIEPYTTPQSDSLPNLTIGRLINLCYFLLYIIFKKCKKNNINIAFHNYKIKYTQNQTPVLSSSKMAKYL